MKTIRIAFEGFWPGFDKNNNFITEILKSKYYVQILGNEHKEEVQYLFYSEFSDAYLDYDCVRIYYTGENICPDMNACDYAIGFEYMEMGDRYLRYPLYLAMYENDVKAMLRKSEDIDQSFGKRKFCSMVVSNSEWAAPARHVFFEKLSEYSQVDSGGRYLNNIGCPEGVKDKEAFQKQYKFSIAFENSSHPGYCTEKLIQSFAAQTVPIYWGDPQVGKVFNEKSFINCHNFETWDDVVEYVKKVDQDDALYLAMLREPVITQEKIELEKQLFAEWLLHITEQDYSTAFRRNRYGQCKVREYNLKRNREMLEQIKRTSAPKTPLHKRVARRFRYMISAVKQKEQDEIEKAELQAGKEYCFGEKNPDKIFYIIRRLGGKLGLLSFFNTHMGHISYALKQGYIPIIDMQNYENLYLEDEEVGKKNAWEYYFVQPFGRKYTLEEVYQSKHVIFSDLQPISPRPDDDMDFLMNKRAHKYWHNIYCQYSRVNETIEKAVSEYYSNTFEPCRKKGERILGVCLRGTDYYALRPNEHPIQPNIEDAIIEVHTAMKEWECQKIYLVTEDAEILREMQNSFREKLLRYDSQIYKYSGSGYIGDSEGIWRENDRYLHGKEYLCSILLLTKCNCFIGGRTSGTVAMHIMSDGFEHEKFFDYGRYGTAEYAD